MTDEQDLADVNLQYLLVGKERQDKIMQELSEEW